MIRFLATDFLEITKFGQIEDHEDVKSFGPIFYKVLDLLYENQFDNPEGAFIEAVFQQSTALLEALLSNAYKRKKERYNIEKESPEIHTRNKSECTEAEKINQRRAGRPHSVCHWRIGTHGIPSCSH